MNYKIVIGIWSLSLVLALSLSAALRIFVSSGACYYITTYFIIILTFIVFGYRLCCCKNRKNETSGTANDEVNATPTTPPPERRKPSQRLYFLDTVKIFLTFIVLTHHVICGFGGCGPGSWYLIVGNYESIFNLVFSSIVNLNQSYFMPLFFFISAYFTPISYEKKGRNDFMHDKAKRLWLPACLTTFTIVPATSIIGQIISKTPTIAYIPLPGPTWFLYWLLVFNWIYTTIHDSYKKSPQYEEEPQPKPIPTFWKRWLAGSIICGILMFAFAIVTGWIPFFGMPVAVGSFMNDVLFFTMGVYASQNSWLSSLDVAWPTLYFTAALEAALVAVFGILSKSDEVFFIPFFIITGLFCVDFSMALMHFCKCYGNSLNKFGLFLAKSAYAVYLIHPFIVTGLTACFIMIYNEIYGEVITFDKGSIASSSMLLGPGDGSLHLFIGFFVVNLLSHLICWPIGYSLKLAPFLREIL